MNYFKRDNCRGCHSQALKLWFSLGKQPPANNLLKNPAKHEEEFPLDVYYCCNCSLVQLLDVVNPAILFENYLYHSSTAPSFIKHFEDFAQKVYSQYQLKRGNLVVDIGSNDGILLKPFKALGCRVVGVDPAQDIALKATEEGVDTVAAFFNSKIAQMMVDSKGTAKVVTATNVFAHIDDLDEILRGVDILLDQDGVFIIEVAYLPEMLKAGTFDLVYHEHLCYYTMTSLLLLLRRFGYSIYGHELIPVHGGSLRVYAKKGVIDDLDTERLVVSEGDILNSEEFKNFPKKLDRIKGKVLEVLRRIKAEGGKIVGYGAPAKMSTMTNFFKLHPQLINFIVDDSPFKQDRFSPGKHIAIKHPGVIIQSQPDYVFLFAWNFAEPIMAKLKEQGYKGKFIIPFPEVKII